MSNQLVPVIFGNTYESLFNGLKGRLDAEAEQKLAALGVDMKRLDPAYPVEVFHRSLRILADSAFPSLSIDEAMFELGRAFVLGMASTTVGKALYTLSRVIGPRRMLERMTRNARTSNNFSESSLEVAPDARSSWSPGRARSCASR